MSVFGWSLPAGVHTLPGEEEDERPRLHCQNCGSFLPEFTNHHEHWTATAHCPGSAFDHETGMYLSACDDNREHGSHEFIVDSGVYEIRTCKRCTYVNKHNQ